MAVAAVRLATGNLAQDGGAAFDGLDADDGGAWARAGAEHTVGAQGLRPDVDCCERARDVEHCGGRTCADADVAASEGVEHNVPTLTGIDDGKVGVARGAVADPRAFHVAAVAVAHVADLLAGAAPFESVSWIASVGCVLATWTVCVGLVVPTPNFPSLSTLTAFAGDPSAAASETPVFGVRGDRSRGNELTRQENEQIRLRWRRSSPVSALTSISMKHCAAITNCCPKSTGVVNLPSDT